MPIQIQEDAAQWKKRKDAMVRQKRQKAMYGILALVCLICSFAVNEAFFLGFIAFGIASKP